jgi:hypothetical protein
LLRSIQLDSPADDVHDRASGCEEQRQVAGQAEKYKRYRVRKHRFYHGVCPDVADRRYDRPAIFFAIPIFSRDAAGLANA